MEVRTNNIERKLMGVQREVSRLSKTVGAMREMLIEMQNWTRRKDEEEVRRRDLSGKANQNMGIPQGNFGNNRRDGSLRTSGAVNDHNLGGKNEAGNSSNPRHNRGESGGRKLEIPIFSGKDPHEWVFRIERYFNVNGKATPKVLAATVVCMDRDEGSTYESLMGNQQLGMVEEHRQKFEAIHAPLVEEKEEVLIHAFYDGLKSKFRAKIRLAQSNKLVHLLGLAQRIEKKNWALEDLKIGPGKHGRSVGLNGFSYGHGLGSLENGLGQGFSLFENGLGRRFNSLDNGLGQGFNSSKFGLGRTIGSIENGSRVQSNLTKIANNSRSNSFNNQSRYSGNSSPERRSWEEAPSSVATAFSYRSSNTTVNQQSDSSFIPQSSPPFRRMTEEEIQWKKEKGLCFRSDTKFSSEHRCSEKQFQIILAKEEDEEELGKEKKYDERVKEWGGVG